jgi:metal-sulfur cluster biosynthetic enzyme
MTEETTSAIPQAPAPASSCCSDHPHHHHHSAPVSLPVAEGLPIASDCCSSASGCSSEAAAVDSTPVDDATLIDALREVIDPELMINIVDLGLVYSINHTDRKVNVEMTLTSPACPAGPQIIMQSKMALEKLSGIDVAEIKLTMSPPWTPARMTDEARDQLGIF